MNIRVSTQIISRKKILIPVGVFLIFVIVLQIWVMNRLSNLGAMSIEIDQSKATLALENQILENQIADKSALQKLKPLADNLGFTNQFKIESIESVKIASR